MNSVDGLSVMRMHVEYLKQATQEKKVVVNGTSTSVTMNTILMHEIMHLHTSVTMYI